MLALAQNGYCLPIIEKDIQVSRVLNTCELNNEFILGFNVEIIGVSGDMRHKIEKAITKAKAQCFKSPIPEWKKDKKWCSNGGDGIEFDYLSLDIDMSMEGITYSISGGFHDIMDDMLEGEISIPMDLHKYNGMVKNLVHRYIDDKYFRNC